ncbi:MAG: sensor histidine kinase [Verrucomicrobiota bacterium]
MPLAEFEEQAKFREGTRDIWSSADFDDRHWAPIATGKSLPADWSWRSKAGWYRIRFAIDEEFANVPLALSAGYIGTISELYLNGERIGGEGDFDSQAFPAPRTLHAAILPPNLVQFGEKPVNVLAIRVLNIGGSPGMVGGPIGVYHASDLTRLRKTEELPHEYVRVGGAALCLFLAGALFPFRNRHGFRGASSVLLLSGVAHLYFAHFFESAMLLSPAVIGFIWSIQWLMPLMVLRFACIAAPSGRFRYHWVLAGLAWFGYLGGTGKYLDELGMIIFSLGVYTLQVFAIAFVILIRGVRAGDPNARPVLIPIAILAFGCFLEFLIIGHPNIPAAAIAAPFSTLTTIAFGAGLLLLTVRRQFVAWREKQQLQERILTAHEEERRRLGHNLHDTLAQELQLLHLQAQMGDGNLASGLQHALREVRVMAEDLQPLETRSCGLVDAFEELARQPGPEIFLDFIPQLPELTDLQRETIYRIAQQATQNAIQHGKPKTIRIQLRADALQLKLDVIDDGAGFDAAQSSDRLGLRFMKDRANLVNGRLRIESTPGSGSTILLTIPLQTQLAIAS